MKCPKCGVHNEQGSTECRVCAVQFKDVHREPPKSREQCRCSWGKSPCDELGIFTNGTTGGGSWYCREHWAVLSGQQPSGRGNQLPWDKSGPSARVAGLVWDNEAKRYRVAQEAAA